MLDNKNIQKVFSLSDFRKKQLLGEIPERNRETYREFGYFGGGFPVRSTVDRIDYSNDTQTAIVRNPLTIARHNLSATGNSNFGYFGGGVSFPGPIIYSIVERIDYSNDNSTTSPRGPLSLARYASSATGNQNFGYFGGGNITSIVDRIDYSNDNSTASVRGPLLQGRQYSAATGNSNFGYFGGGVVSNVFTSTLDRIDYFNDTAKSSIRGSLNRPGLRITRLAATGNSNFGYFGGGWTPAPVTIVDRIDYSNDTAQASVRGSLSSSRYGLTATGNSNFGYFSGGIVNAPFASRSTVDRIDYSNDTITASARGPLSSARGYISATSSSSFGGAPNSSFASDFTFPTVPNAGYFGGGFDGTNSLATIDKVDYANDTATASARSALSSARYSLAATGNGSFGYFAGGRPSPSSPDTSTIDRIEYASDTQNAVARSTLNNAVRLLAAAGNSNFGYFSGGFSTRNGVDRLDYSTDTTATSPRQGLPLATYSLAATGNRNFGYFCGGLTASPTTNRSEIYRVDYSNDSTIPQNRGPLSEAKRDGTATGNDSFGYFSGAVNPGLSPSYRSQIERIDYSNDTVIASVRSRLNTPLFSTGATGNSNFGYFGAGTNGPANFSTTDRINYSNDTAVASIRGPLSTGKSSLAATSPLAYGGAPIYFTNPLPEVLQKQIIFNDANTLDLPFKRVLGSFGYFGGGSAASRVDRVDYSNDLVNASIRGPLSSAKYALAAGNSNFGYFAGNATTIMDRIDYSNDLSTAINRGSLVPGSTGERSGSTENSNFGYISYGPSILNKINFSNDSATALSRTPFNFSTFGRAATGNNNFGYFGGGNFPITISTVERINYSNDTQTASIRGPLVISRWRFTATGNSNFGYFGGGREPMTTTVDRIDYSNDTASASIRGPLTGVRLSSGATGNSNFGYFGGGNPSISSVDRIDYSNDMAIASIRGPLSSARAYLDASTNASNS